eukprot:2260106-Alexandrium_andersonii.AAC.1
MPGGVLPLPAPIGDGGGEGKQNPVEIGSPGAARSAVPSAPSATWLTVWSRAGVAWPSRPRTASGGAATRWLAASSLRRRCS